MTEFFIRDEVTGITIGVVRENGWNTVNWSSGNWNPFGFGSGLGGQAAQIVDSDLDGYILDRQILASENAKRAALTASYINSLEGIVVVPGTGQTLSDIAWENLDRLGFGYVVWDDTLGPPPTIKEMQRAITDNAHDLVPGMKLKCFPAGTSIMSSDGSFTDIASIQFGDTVSVLDVSSTGTVTQVFRNITTEWLEVVWTHPETGSIEQIISTPGHRFLKPDGSYDRIIDMVDRSVVVADAANDNHDENGSSFGGAHPFSQGEKRPFGVGPDEQIVSDAWMPAGTAGRTVV